MGAASSSPLGKSTTARGVVDHFSAAAASASPSTLLAGKTALVTGAASGIGTETVKALTYAGCRVLATARDVTAGAAHIKAYVASEEGGYAGKPDLVTVLPLDLESLASVQACAAAALGAAPVIDLVVLNAGIMALPRREETPHGLEKQLGTNHFGHHLLVSLLRARLVAQTGGARVVFLSSLAHKRGSIDIADLHFSRGRAYAPWVAYGQSKLANLLDAKELADQLADTPVVAVSVHPGVISTNLARHILQGGSVSARLMRMVLETFIVDKDIPQGAATTLFACLEPSLARPELRGSYLADCAVTAPNAEGQDADKAGRKALWAATEEQLKAALDKMAAAPASA